MSGTILVVMMMLLLMQIRAGCEILPTVLHSLAGLLADSSAVDGWQFGCRFNRLELVVLVEVWREAEALLELAEMLELSRLLRVQLVLVDVLQTLLGLVLVVVCVGKRRVVVGVIRLDYLLLLSSSASRMNMMLMLLMMHQLSSLILSTIRQVFDAAQVAVRFDANLIAARLELADRVDAIQMRAHRGVVSMLAHHRSRLASQAVLVVGIVELVIDQISAELFAVVQMVDINFIVVVVIYHHGQHWRPEMRELHLAPSRLVTFERLVDLIGHHQRQVVEVGLILSSCRSMMSTSNWRLIMTRRGEQATLIGSFHDVTVVAT